VWLYPVHQRLDSSRMTDDEGVLGNLPRSRPGHRSEKRPERDAPASGEGTAARAATRAERTGAKAAQAPPGSEPRKRTPPKARRQGAPASAGAGRERADDGGPVGDALRTVTGVAATGARVAHGVAREVLRRLPRP
jgi:hypothetical protein